MESATKARPRPLPSDLLLLVQIFTLPLMKPGVVGPVIVADVLFVLLVLTFAAEVVAGLRRVTWISGFAALLVYVACLSPSLLQTSDMGASLFKLSTEFYLIGLAAVAAAMVDDETKFHRVLLAWLAASAILGLDAVISLIAFLTGRLQWLLDFSTFGFGSLPPGDYPRLALTFFNANMACNYLTVSLALVVLARRLGYIGRAAYFLLLAGVIIASLSTISSGLGGIALLGGILIWLDLRDDYPAVANASLPAGALVAALFIVALAFTPFQHSTAPFAIQLPGGATVYPAPRLMTWTAALKQFLAHPLVGIGIGIDPVHVGFANPNGYEVLTDAHNIFLSIAAQSGLAGLAGLLAIIGVASARMRPRPNGPNGSFVVFVLAATFLDVFVYQGLSGSFEDARHIWVLLGLLLAASRIEFQRNSVNGGQAQRE